jgi:hypothetical protein
MAHRIVLISCPIRGGLHSPKRRADMAYARCQLAHARKAHPEVVFTAPYLLHAEAAEDIVGARLRYAGWEHNPPTEWWGYGNWCEGMRGEYLHMLNLGLPTKVHTKRSCVGMAPHFCVAAE